MLKPSDCTVIIPHLGGTQEAEYALKECLKSLKETVPDIKIIVAYNNFEGWDGPVEKDTIYLEAQGQCKAVNAAVATVNTPWVFITNDDMIYAPGWFEKLQEADYEDLCVSPKLVEPRKGAPTFIEYFCGGAGGDFDKTKWLEFVKKYYEEHSAIETSPGFNMPLLIRKDLWDTIGGYDINYDPWGSNSDSDLEYKIKLTGVQSLQRESCIVYHFSQTSGTFEPKNRESWELNWQYFIEKWGFPRTDDGIWEANFKIPSVEEGRVFTPSWENKYGR